MFYDYMVDICNETYTKNEYGDRVKTKTVIDTIECDMQPYSSTLASRDYGLDISCTNRIFANINSNIKQGNFIFYNSNYYLITSTIIWEDYIEAMVNRI
ncbi:hypothetical protein [Clostridium grantii]|uniref:Uncharacterized protein n=1 Tax=Clostridium grantii DSM 8605 TaxID=1121316 RepID=A0A1M5SC76_9CLOT|nr:hypothetical protein [Clostridium grantii]SHH36187.1 hypothetical protein SAMN02745207_00865 [Clostridium grantii DSM 8605]